MSRSIAAWGSISHDVDLIGGDFPADLRQAIATVADRNDLEWNWVNDGGTVGAPVLEPKPRPLYVGENFAAYSPDDRYLLAMKLFAARNRDFDDAVRLSTETDTATPRRADRTAGLVRSRRRRSPQPKAAAIVPSPCDSLGDGAPVVPFQCG